MVNADAPSLKQIENCKGFGWEYVGDKLFYKRKTEQIGWFEDGKFHKENFFNPPPPRTKQ